MAVDPVGRRRPFQQVGEQRLALVDLHADDVGRRDADDQGAPTGAVPPDERMLPVRLFPPACELLGRGVRVHPALRRLEGMEDPEPGEALLLRLR